MNQQGERFPLLREFLRGYLHQDVVPEHGSPLSAAKVYFADLNKADRQRLSREAAQFRDSHRSSSIEQLNRQLGAMGSAWSFNSASEFLDLLSEFDGTD